MDCRPRGHDGQHQPTLTDIAHQIEGAAQALAWLHLVEEQRQPALAAAATHLAGYARTTRQAVDAGDTETLDEVATLRLGTLAALLQVMRTHWEHGVRGMTTWTANALAEIAHWIEQAREAIGNFLQAPAAMSCMRG